MALDPSISLQARGPGDIYALGQEKAMNQAKVDDIPRQQQMQKIQDAQAKTTRALQLAAMANEGNYQAVRSQAIKELGPDIENELPPVYDPQAIRSIQMQLMPIKDQLDLAAKQYDRDFDREKFSETQRHNLTSEANTAKMAGSLFGNSMEGKAYNILLNGNPESPEYALAYSAASKPQIKPVTQPDGSIQLVAVTPELPSTVKAPGGLTPPPMRGTADNTPTTPADQMLSPPSGLPNPKSPMKSFNVQPIAGTQGTPKATDAQSTAALYAKRMEESDKIIQGLENTGIAKDPTLNTRTGSALTNWSVGKEGQQFVQAQRDFINAVLRRESGAVIADSEFANARQQYFPQPGDKPETIAQKAANRRTAIEGIKNAAGPALKRDSTDLSKMSDDELLKMLKGGQ